jgi:hypothetical protein
MESLSCVTTLEERYYAHRKWRNLLVLELSANNSGCVFPSRIPLERVTKDLTLSEDVTLERVKSHSAFGVYEGVIKRTEHIDSEKVRVAFAVNTIPSFVTVNANSLATFHFVSAFVSSLESGPLVRQITVD